MGKQYSEEHYIEKEYINNNLVKDEDMNIFDDGVKQRITGYMNGKFVNKVFRYKNKQRTHKNNKKTQNKKKQQKKKRQSLRQRVKH